MALAEIGRLSRSASRNCSLIPSLLHQANSDDSSITTAPPSLASGRKSTDSRVVSGSFVTIWNLDGSELANRQVSSGSVTSWLAQAKRSTARPLPVFSGASSSAGSASAGSKNRSVLTDKLGAFTWAVPLKRRPHRPAFRMLLSTLYHCTLMAPQFQHCQYEVPDLDMGVITLFHAPQCGQGRNSEHRPPTS